jgi:hypothetical protein
MQGRKRHRRGDLYLIDDEEHVNVVHSGPM